jgi:hypothetical protein
MQDVSKINLGAAASINPTNHIVMRKWLKDEFMRLQALPEVLLIMAFHVRPGHIRFYVQAIHLATSYFE